MRVVAVSDPINRVVGPVQGARLDGRLETGEHFQVRRFPVTAARVAGAAIHRRIVPGTLVRLKWLKRKKLIS